MCFGWGIRGFQDYELEESCKTKHTHKTSYVVPTHSKHRCSRCNGCECNSCHSHCRHDGYIQQPNMTCKGTGTEVIVHVKPPGHAHHHHGHGHNHVYPGGTRFIQAPGGVMMARQPYLGTGGGCGGSYSGGTGPIWNGQQWVTHGLTARDHILKMKAKADKKPQELAPADGDIKRMYEVQELDGNWTRRNRFTIDSGEIGKIRWFQRPDGSFFAKRLLTG